ncbi:F0F1 ATP synthase subunit gamma [Ligilactobacillus saerimneri]|uniref:ATP synthase gamma chain n=1 Tax=Ligilactobacillus saerimneri 30a TaxID=1227363 RepID=M5J554_9LACO|nr:F0F1 ATP synthase subunit gamma [Ligilactobacillus saerimneri]EKW99011.1 F0F1 ATP synthase subunit gamma [Ligilactobacillus saerimneri 30a]MBU5309407.1 F0F1 ATP synthase subunit gamma [Ligilactobacillus saerimneri]MDI9205875.1 F0F1 ATP synthase subunit gamma [Ligilactobacillus saerimneri]MDY4002896.1 F0F1 ATP synthase subunit gamma [Ligilactobacillus saerimneri]
MATSLKEVKEKINSTKKTGQITGAMQMISTAKLGQIQSHTVSYQKYSTKIKSVITHLAQAHFLSAVAQKNVVAEETEEQPFIDPQGKRNYFGLLEQRPVENVGIIVVTSDRGLVGGYNSNVLKQTMELINQLDFSKENIKIIAVGRTGLKFFKKQGYNVIHEYTGVKDIPDYKETKSLTRKVMAMYENQEFDHLYVCYNHFVNMLTSEYRSELLLPVTEESLGVKQPNEFEDNEVQVEMEYDIEPSETEILNVVLPQYAEGLVYGAILDAKTAEHASSATAMKSATDNAQDIISTLQLQYNRARQAAITTEITEITGAQAAIE